MAHKVHHRCVLPTDGVDDFGEHARPLVVRKLRCGARLAFSSEEASVGAGQQCAGGDHLDRGEHAGRLVLR